MDIEQILQMGSSTILSKDFCESINSICCCNVATALMISSDFFPLKTELMIFHVNLSFGLENKKLFYYLPYVEKKNCNV